MTRLLKQFILTAMLALFGSQASALFIQPDTFDPRMQGVGTNRYAYAMGDPINSSDRNGHARCYQSLESSANSSLCDSALNAADSALEQYKTARDVLDRFANQEGRFSNDEMSIVNRYFSLQTNGESASDFNSDNMSEFVSHLTETIDSLGVRGEGHKIRWRNEVGSVAEQGAYNEYMSVLNRFFQMEATNGVTYPTGPEFQAYTVGHEMQHYQLHRGANGDLKYGFDASQSYNANGGNPMNNVDSVNCVVFNCSQIFDRRILPTPGTVLPQ